MKASNTSGVALAKIVKRLLQTFQLTDKVFAYVKDKGANLATLATALSSMVTCGPLEMTVPGTCFGHVMSKVWHANVPQRYAETCRR